MCAGSTKTQPPPTPTSSIHIQIYGLLGKKAKENLPQNTRHTIPRLCVWFVSVLCVCVCDCERERERVWWPI